MKIVFVSLIGEGILGIWNVLTSVKEKILP
jgi:hypothetical protein